MGLYERISKARETQGRAQAQVTVAGRQPEWVRLHVSTDPNVRIVAAKELTRA